MIWLAGGDRTGERVNHVFATYDGGRTWNNLKNVDTEPLYSVYGMGESAWAGGAGGVLKTTDHGLSWTRHSVGSAYSAQGLILCQREQRLGGFGRWLSIHERGWWRKWSVQKRDRGDSFTSLHFHDEQRGWVAGTGGWLLRYAEPRMGAQLGLPAYGQDGFFS